MRLPHDVDALPRRPDLQPRRPVARPRCSSRDGRIAWLGADADAPGRRPGPSTSTARWSPRRSSTPTCTPPTPGLALHRAGPVRRPARRRRCSTAVAALRGEPARATRSCSGTAGTSRPGPDQRPPTAAELDRAAGGRPVYLSRASTSTRRWSPRRCSTLAAAGRPPGYDRAGWLRRGRPPRRAGARDGLDHPRPAPRRPSAPRCGTPPRWASPRCTSAAGRTPPARTTSPACSRWPRPSGLPGGVRATGASCTAAAKAQRARRRRRGRRPVRRRRARLAHRVPAASPTRRRRARGHGYLTAEQVARPRGRLHRGTACRAGSTRSATRRSRPSWTGSRRAAAAGRRRPDPGRPAPRRARRDDGQGADRGASSSSGSSPQCSRRSTGCGAASDGMYAQRLGVDRAAGVQPVRGHARGRRAAGVRLGLTGHAAGPVGHGPGGDAPPQPGHRMLRAGRVRRAHPRRLAGRAPRRRGGAGAGRAGDVRGVGRRPGIIDAGCLPGRPTTRPLPVCTRTVLRGTSRSTKAGLMKGKLDLDPRAGRPGP